MKAIMTDDGLLIPKAELERWGEVVVEERPYELVIRPKSVTQLTYGSLRADPSVLDQLLEDVEAGGAASNDTDLDRVPILNAGSRGRNLRR
jgi:hypothetical protein